MRETEKISCGTGDAAMEAPSSVAPLLLPCPQQGCTHSVPLCGTLGPLPRGVNITVQEHLYSSKNFLLLTGS